MTTLTESQEERKTRLKEDSQKLIKQLVPDIESLKCIQKIFEKQLTDSLAFGPTRNTSFPTPTIRLLDTHISELCTHKESGTFYTISIESIGVRIAPVTLKPPYRCIVHTSEIVEVTYSSQEKFPSSIKTLAHQDISATIFIKTVLAAVDLFISSAKKKAKEDIKCASLPEFFEFILVSSYYLDKTMSQCELFMFHELAQKHLHINDPLIGVDLIYLCNVRFANQGVPAKIIHSISKPSAILLSTSFESARSQPPCLVAIDIDDQVQISFYDSKSDQHKFQGKIIDIDLAHFTGNDMDASTYCLKYGLPYIASDFEIQPGREKQYWRDFEKLVGASSIPEICRKTIIRLFQAEAPLCVWVPQSLTIADCLAVLNDTSELKIVDNVMRNVWNWNLNLTDLHTIKKIIVAILTRSAALVAICLSVIAKRTGKLQPALGGVTVALTGALGGNLCYHKLLRFYLDKLFSKDTSKLIQFYRSTLGPIKGAALLGKLQQKTSGLTKLQRKET